MYLLIAEYCLLRYFNDLDSLFWEYRFSCVYRNYVTNIASQINSKLLVQMTCSTICRFLSIKQYVNICFLMFSYYVYSEHFNTQ